VRITVVLLGYTVNAPLALPALASINVSHHLFEY